MLTITQKQQLQNPVHPSDKCKPTKILKQNKKELGLLQQREKKVTYKDGTSEIIETSKQKFTQIGKL